LLLFHSGFLCVSRFCLGRHLIVLHDQLPPLFSWASPGVSDQPLKAGFRQITKRNRRAMPLIHSSQHGKLVQNSIGRQWLLYRTRPGLSTSTRPINPPQIPSQSSLSSSRSRWDHFCFLGPHFAAMSKPSANNPVTQKTWNQSQAWLGRHNESFEHLNRHQLVSVEFHPSFSVDNLPRFFEKLRSSVQDLIILVYFYSQPLFVSVLV
jgi:hypothetical protein